MTKRQPPPTVNHDLSLLSDDDLYLFNEGSFLRMYDKLGSHVVTVDGTEGTSFGVWAPNAEQVSVIGDFNGWNRESHPLRPRGSSGIWEGFVPGVGHGAIYKYWIVSRGKKHRVEKADPLAAHAETPPKTGSVVWDLGYDWGDRRWIKERGARNSLGAPISVYEVHIGSWRRVPEEDNRPLTYRELAEQLPEYVKGMGFSHVEFLPVMEHPFYGSWGYQTTGYFAPTSRYGTPQDFMHLVDRLHQDGIGVVLDWVPSHFPNDEHGLAYFDGTHLYEHADPRRGFHPDWKSAVFNYGRNEVRSFLLSSACFWLDKYHIDGLRVDAVASMLYLDYSREQGEWLPNEYGGNENLEAVGFLRRLNEDIYREYPDVQTIAEESTAWPMVSRPVYLGGLGFGMKWDMGWMHDTLEYMSHDPVYRRYHHGSLTFRMVYAFMENFMLSLSHDEVVHGKRSLISKMPGDDFQKAANLRLLYSYMFTQPGKKLLFMGGEFAQWMEWDHEASLAWDSLNSGFHGSIWRLVQDLNRTYRSEPALHESDCIPGGFEWIDPNDSERSVLTYLRKVEDGSEGILVACNFTPMTRENYRVGVPFKGEWREILNSDADFYGGSGIGNLGGVTATPISIHGRPYSINITIPPLAAVLLKGKAERS
jgi:1,4-alpha-glucan branching enzyme